MTGHTQEGEPWPLVSIGKEDPWGHSHQSQTPSITGHFCHIQRKYNRLGKADSAAGTSISPSCLSLAPLLEPYFKRLTAMSQLCHTRKVPEDGTSREEASLLTQDERLGSSRTHGLKLCPKKAGPQCAIRGTRARGHQLPKTGPWGITEHLASWVVTPNGLSLRQEGSWKARSQIL